jgi:hypothetical protein
VINQSWKHTFGITSPTACTIVLKAIDAWHRQILHHLQVARHNETVKANPHMPCRAPVILRQRRVLRENPRGSRKYPNCYTYSLTDWYASDNNLRGTPRGSGKKPKAGKSPTCCHKTVDANSHMPCHAHAALCSGLEKSLSEGHGSGMGTAWHV